MGAVTPASACDFEFREYVTRHRTILVTMFATWVMSTHSMCRTFNEHAIALQEVQHSTFIGG